MRRVVLLKNGNSGFEMTMWVNTLEFWKIPYEIIDSETFLQLDSNRCEVVLAAGLREISADCSAQLDRYLNEGGNVLICGGLPQRLVGYFGGIRVRPVKRGKMHRCIRLTIPEGFVDWNSGDILFFTNTYHSSGLDYEIVNEHELIGNVLARSQEMSIANEDTEEWGDWRQTPGATIIEAKVNAGKMVYIPLPIGAMDWVVQPRIPTFTEFPYILRNNGLILFMRHLLEYMTGPGPITRKELWPNGAKCVVALTGDVHDYEGLPGRADREYRDMLDYMNILKENGLDGRATLYITGAAVKRHPEAILEGFERGYEMCSHTYQDTCYSNQGFDYESQKSDILRCSDAFQKVAPSSDTYRKGFRTHGYNSNYDTRLALENLEYEYLADLQGWQVAGKYDDRAPDQLITYCSYPQHARDYRGRKLKLLEIPDTVANDHFVYRIKKMTPDQALEFYKSEFDRLYRMGGLFQTCLHPYVSLKEDPAREKTYRELIAYITSHDDVLFLRMDEIAKWWKQQFNDYEENAV